MRKLLSVLMFLGVLEASDHAIVVGCCTEYQNPDNGIPLLRGVKNDATHILDTLLDRGVKRSNIDYLVEKDATYKNITQSIKSMESKDLKKGDTLYLFYSGHGTSLEDRSSFGKKLRTNRELLERLDGSTGFIPYDFDMESIKNTLIITSRDFRPSFETLDKRGVKIVWIVDACFSGNAYRSIGDDESKKVNLSSKSKSFADELSQSMGKKKNLYKNLLFYGATTTNIKTIETDYKGERRGEFSVEVEKCLNAPYRDRYISNEEFKECLKKNYPPYVFASSIYPIDKSLDNEVLIKASDKASSSNTTYQNFREKLFALENSQKALDLNIYSTYNEDIATDIFCQGEELAIKTETKGYIIALTQDRESKVIMLEPNSNSTNDRISKDVVSTKVQEPFGRDRVKVFSTQNKALYTQILAYKNRLGGVLFDEDIENIYNILKNSNDFQTASLEVKTIETDVHQCRKGDR